MMRSISQLMVVLAATAMTHPAAAEPVPNCRTDAVLLFQDASAPPITITVEIADTPKSRSTGLMHREPLPARHGMLFIYEKPQPVAFWMRNTPAPLDMLFIDARGEIRHIHENAIPFDETPIPGAVAGDTSPDRLMVLEIAGRQAAALGVAEGMAIAHPALPAATALYPCA